MLGYKPHLFFAILFTSLLTLNGCTVTKQKATTDLGKLEELRMQYSRDMTGSKPDAMIRMTGLAETAQSLGARAALANRAKRINKVLKEEQRKLDNVYNFYSLLLPNNVLPPVLVQGNNSLEVDSDTTLRISDKTYEILEQARFVTAPPTWRTYLWMNYKTPKLPHNSMLPRTSAEKELWKKSVREGWKKGLVQAESIFRTNLATITQKYKGMVLYRQLLAQNMVSAPYVAKTELGVTGDGHRMDVNDKVLRITVMPSLNKESRSWQPAISAKIKKSLPKYEMRYK